MSVKSVDCSVRVVDMLEAPSADPLSLKKGEYTFVYRYPLHTTALFRHALDESTSPIDILVHGATDYRDIYKHPDVHEIWGHDIDDLFFEGIVIDDFAMTIEFEMGS
jgi:hypothetical protein